VAIRIKISHVSRRGTGEVPGVGNATIQAFFRNADGTNGAAAALWTAPTGGTSSTTPRPVSADGTYAYYFPSPNSYNLVEVIDGITMPTIQVGAIAGTYEAFTAASMSNSWVADAAAPPGYTKTSEGLVVVRGHMTRATGSNLSAFTLPAGNRPGNESRFANPINPSAPIIVNTTGTVTFTGSPTDVWLDGVRFVGEL
jgi:hypothetical protein